MKKNIFDQYANAIAKQFHLSLDQMFSPTTVSYTHLRAHET